MTIRNQYNKMKKILLFLILMLSTSLLFNLAAQPPPPGGGGGTSNPNCFPPPCIPIDGGISWLLLAGAAYGGKKLYKANKDKNAEA